jgi:hypothetical protein
MVYLVQCFRDDVYTRRCLHCARQVDCPRCCAAQDAALMVAFGESRAGNESRDWLRRLASDVARLSAPRKTRKTAGARHQSALDADNRDKQKTRAVRRTGATSRQRRR